MLKRITRLSFPVCCVSVAHIPDSNVILSVGCQTLLSVCRSTCGSRFLQSRAIVTEPHWLRNHSWGVCVCVVFSEVMSVFFPVLPYFSFTAAELYRSATTLTIMATSNSFAKGSVRVQSYTKHASCCNPIRCYSLHNLQKLCNRLKCLLMVHGG